MTLGLIVFAKVFAQILDSSLAEDWRVRLVFEDFLKLSDAQGIVDMTRESISRRTNVPLEIVTHGICELEKPDPTSRSPDHEGRRILLLDSHRDWGWRIVNFLKYRQSATKEMLRMAEAERKAEWRRRKGFPAPLPKKTETEAEGEADMSGTNGRLSGHVPDISPSTRAIMQEKELKRIEQAIQQVRLSAGDFWSAEQKAESARLKKRKKELLSEMGCAA